MGEEVIRDKYNRVVGYRGARAGESFASEEEAELKKGDEAFAQKYPGASGIAGANVRLSDAYKKALEADRAERKRKKAPKAGDTPGAPKITGDQAAAALAGSEKDDD
jgi:hypothetical protein